MPRPQFTLRTLLVLLLAVVSFCGGIRFEREWHRRKDKTARPFSCTLSTRGLSAERRRAILTDPQFVARLSARLGMSQARIVELMAHESDSWKSTESGLFFSTVGDLADSLNAANR